ncbi:respiratory nitrate reductase subunit gamma [bacterium]|nr:respiratory nitrate reductase subunit gamma [bacterium]
MLRYRIIMAGCSNCLSNYLFDPETATREIFWNISSPINKLALYGLLAIATVVFAIGIIGRIQLWANGTREPFYQFNPKLACKRLLNSVFLQKRISREKRAGTFHAFVYLGFLALLFATTVVFIDEDLGIKIFRGRFYLLTSWCADVLGFIFLVGVVLFWQRRIKEKPPGLDSTFKDYFMLVLLAILLVQGFLLEGLRIRATNDAWAIYSPIGLLVAKFFWGLPPSIVTALHFITWWVHAITFFIFFAVLPYTKFLHIISSSANLILSKQARPKGALNYPGDMDKILEAAAESETGDFKFGIETIRDLSWKNRLALDACTACGRCQDVCPAYNSGKVLSPKWLILDSRNHLLKLESKNELDEIAPQQSFLANLRRYNQKLLSKFFLPQLDDLRPSDRGPNLLSQNSALAIGISPQAKLAGEVMDEDVFWSCTTCRACEEACPVGIEHLSLITDVRRNLTLVQGSLPSEAQSSLKAIELRGNPFGPAEERFNWAEGLNVPVVAAGQEVEVLYWVGCISAYDRRKQSIARSMVKILNASGLKWGVLGERECCTGDPARRLGEENLYQSQAKQALDVLQSIQVQTIVANCPHCFHALKNEYPDLRPSWATNQIEIIHHSQFVQELIKNAKLTIREQDLGSVTFHDPCYLGRYNDRYEEPRDVLVQLGGKNTEMQDHHRKSKCCGAGGGHFWMDLKVGERVNVQRMTQALETGAKTVATACPFCMHMLEDGAKLKDLAGEITIKDIAELVAERL